MRTANAHVPVPISPPPRRRRRSLAACAGALLVSAGLVWSSPLPSGAIEAGSLDPGFGTGGRVVTGVGTGTEDDGADVAVQPDGKIVVVGNADDDILVLRYNADGSLDTGFSGDGKVTQNVNGVDAGNAVALQADGKIVVAGASGNGTAFAVLRFTASGDLDATFDADGIVTESFTGTATSAADVAVTAAGIVVAGSTGNPGDFALARYTLSGALDPSFDNNGTLITDVGASDDAAASLAVQPDGKLVVAGDSGTDVGVVRYDSAGAPDPTFDGDGKVVTSISGGATVGSVALQADGRIVVGGGTGSADSLLVRYTAAGALDTAFDGDGTVVTDWGNSSQIWSVAVQPDGRIVTAGEDPTASGDFLVARYAADGSLDATFDGDGTARTNFGGDSRALSLALQPDGRIVVAGQVRNADGDVAVARYLGTATADGPSGPLGYRMVAADGGIFTFGQRAFRGSTGDMTLNKPIVGGATNPATLDGYWIVASDGGVFSFGVDFFGSLADTALDSPVAEIEPTPTGLGYWMVTAKGKVYPFGDAVFYGDVTSLNLNQPIVGMTTTSSGKGYWLLGADGGIFSHGDAQFYGSTGGMTLNAPVVDIAGVPGDDGYFLVAGDGGVFTFGSAEFKGSTGDIKLNQPVNSMLVTPDGEGYWLAAADGGVFTFGDAVFLGSMGAVRLNAPVLDLIL